MFYFNPFNLFTGFHFIEETITYLFKIIHLVHRDMVFKPGILNSGVYTHNHHTMLLYVKKP